MHGDEEIGGLVQDAPLELSPVKFTPEYATIKILF
jgi:hypothetical protein